MNYISVWILDNEIAGGWIPSSRIFFNSPCTEVTDRIEAELFSNTRVFPPDQRSPRRHHASYN